MLEAPRNYFEKIPIRQFEDDYNYYKHWIHKNLWVHSDTPKSEEKGKKFICFIGGDYSINPYSEIGSKKK